MELAYGLTILKEQAISFAKFSVFRNDEHAFNTSRVKPRHDKLTQVHEFLDLLRISTYNDVWCEFDLIEDIFK